MNKAALQSLLSPIVVEHRQRSYEFWRSRLDADPITLDMVGNDGSECQVEINAFWDSDPDRDIRVMFSIDDLGWRAFVPVTDSFIIARDGTFVGE
jgi:hypothetical protein